MVAPPTSSIDRADELSAHQPVHNPRFHPISASRAHEEVVDQVTFAIRSGCYRPGDRLPHIEELAQAMNVSKPTVGEAMKLLREHGVVETQRGATGGLTVVTDVIPVSALGMAAERRNLTPQELVEARRPIELSLVMLAAQRGTSADFDQLDAAVDQLESIKLHRGPDVAERWTHYDHLFHYLVGRASRSEALAYYQHAILEQLAIEVSEYFDELEDPELVIELHRETAIVLRNRALDQIESVVDRHLKPLETYVAANFPEEQRPPA